MIVGLDMGGTHIDAVLIHQGEIIKSTKNPTDRGDLLGSIWGTLKSLLPRQESLRAQIKRIILSTTISTNAIIEQKTDPVGMIIECGPGLQNDFLHCGQVNTFISGYIDHRGREVSPIDKLEIERAAKTFKNKDISMVAVIGKFSVRNAEHELKISEILKDKFSHITLGHTLSGKLNFPRRVFTSYYNSAVHTTFLKFSKNISKALEKEKISAPIYVLKADGGTVSLEAGEKYPVNTILSGPAASVMGGQAFLNTSKDAIFLDIGGTTTDISFLADGVPLFEPLGIRMEGLPTLVRALYSVSIGVGGDSEVSVKNQSLNIGPKRQGPPKALGGKYPTPTDAMVTLDLIEIGDKHKAINAMKEIGRCLNLDPKTTAEKILDKMSEMIKSAVEKHLYEINSRPVYTVKELLYGKRIKPAFVQVIGGPAEALAPILAKKFGISCLYPKVYEAANAVGAALARTTAEITIFADTAQKTLSVPEMGLYEKVSKGYSLKEAELRALDLLKRQSTLLGAEKGEIQAEIIEKNSYNMVRGFTTSGKNIRVRAQTKPGLIYQLRGDIDVSSKE